jgi:hypothetical protein
LLLPSAFFFRPLFTGAAFLPADLLRFLSPWSAAEPQPANGPAWNVLRYDGITQYYPWRLQAARALRDGHIPLWNPYQFAARGGTPLLADAQSAPLYPPNVVFWAMPPGAFWYAFGLSAALHLLWAAAGMYRLLRAAGARRLGSLLAAATFAMSAPIVTWLSLPTFLCVASWIPWLLLLLKRSHDLAGTRAGRLSALGASAAGGAMLLGGHLQMAFYGLLAGAVYLLWRGHGFVWNARAGERGARARRWAVAAGGGALLALCVALPQVLPAVSLSRVSHRATGAPPSWVEYRIYVSNALPVRQLVTLLSPEFYGDPNAGTYWQDSDRPGGNNYAEWAIYVGVIPVALAAFALALPWRRPAGTAGSAVTIAPERLYFALLGAVTLLFALGTPLNMPFFFLVPGFSQMGNPARCLPLLALALSGLAGLGLDALMAAAPAPSVKRRAAITGVFCVAILAAVGASQSVPYAAASVPEQSFADLISMAGPDIARGVALLLVAGLAMLVLPGLTPPRRTFGGICLGVIAAAELFSWGNGYNPASPAAQVYPTTDGIRFLQQHGSDALVAVLNRHWSLGARPPHATLPPNALTVYALHDVGGYDSLFPGDAKRQIRAASGGDEDPSPPENGNMAFVKRATTAVALGARYVVAAPDAASGSLAAAGLTPAYAGPDLQIWENPAGRSAPAPPPQTYDTFRIGLFCGLAAVGTIAAGLAGATAAGFATERRLRSAPHRTLLRP